MTDRPTDGPTDLPTDTARCRVACPRLKREGRKKKTEKEGFLLRPGNKVKFSEIPLGSLVLFCIQVVFDLEHFAGNLLGSRLSEFVSK